MRLAAILLAVVAALQAEEFTARVVCVADGDTITVLREKAQVRIRLHGVDAPEKAQPFGSRARQFTGDLAHGKPLTIMERDRNRYGRTVAGVILPDGKSFNHEIAATPKTGKLVWNPEVGLYVPLPSRLARD